jgi:hypothetical protein
MQNMPMAADEIRKNGIGTEPDAEVRNTLIRVDDNNLGLHSKCNTKFGHSEHDLLKNGSDRSMLHKAAWQC